MQITVEIPEAVDPAQDHVRAALEAFAIAVYRSGALSFYDTQRLLGFPSSWDLDGFLKEHDVWEHAYNLQDLEDDRATLASLA